MYLKTDETKENRERYKIFFIIYFLFMVGIAFLRTPDLRNELKYFLVTDQMLTTKNFVILGYFNELYPDKPPIYFWLLGIIRSISKDSFYPLALIFGSIIPAMITGVLGFKIFKLYWSEKMAYLSLAIFITLPYLLGISLVLRMDYLMTAFIFGALYIFFKSYSEKDKKKISLQNIFLIYLFITLGVLIKGGAAIVIPVLTILTFLYLDRNLKYLKNIKPLFGIGVIFSILGLWFLLILNLPNGKEYASLLLGRETIGRVVKAKTHTRPIYYYIKNLIFTVLPLTPFLVRGSINSLKNIKLRHKWKLVDKISLSLFLPNLLFFSLISGKLDIYLLPLYYGVVVIALRFIEHEWSGTKESICKKILYINVGIGVLCAVALPYYNKNYTMMDAIKILKENTQNVYSYRFNDAKNILTEINKKSLDDLPLDELYKINEGELLLARKKYYKDIPLQNFKEIYSNNEYIILIRE